MLSASELREMFYYDPCAGSLTWRICASNCIKVGDEAGSRRSDGRQIVWVNGRFYLRYRIAWCIMTDVWPEQEIDHIDGDPSNDRWVNLREATSSQNKMNTKRKSSLPRGVHQNRRGAFYVQVWADGKCHNGGTFETVHQAAVARADLARKLHGEFMRA